MKDPALQKWVSSIAEFTDKLSSVDSLPDTTAYCGAAMALITVKAQIKFIEDRRKTIGAGARQVLSELDGFFGPVESELNAAESRLKALISSYVDGHLPEAVAKAQAALAAGNRDALMAAVTPIPSVDGIKLSTHTDFVVEDESQVPEAFWIVEKKLNRKAVAASFADGKPVPGVVSKDTTRVSVTIPPTVSAFGMNPKSSP